jgi:hypothetical protein
VLRGTLVLLGAALLLAGCGGGGKKSAGPCQSAAQLRALAQLQADLREIKRAAAIPVHDSLKGGPAINRATDRFLRDVELAPLDNLVRNRLIDHAAALLLGACDQCFQALEAERPIISIEHKHDGAACHAKS